MELTGIDVKKSPKDNVYACVTQVVFPDDDGTLRCGKMAVCFQKNDKWLAIVGRWLFTNTWNPKTSDFDPDDPILGKSCFVGKWTTPFFRVDVCHIENNIIVPTLKIGIVIEVVHPFAIVKLTKEFVESEEFREHGFWFEMKDSIPEIKESDTLVMAGETTCNNTPVMRELKPKNLFTVDDNYWPEDNDPISCIRILFR